MFLVPRDQKLFVQNKVPNTPKSKIICEGAKIRPLYKNLYFILSENEEIQMLDLSFKDIICLFTEFEGLQQQQWASHDPASAFATGLAAATAACRRTCS